MQMVMLEGLSRATLSAVLMDTERRRYREPAIALKVAMVPVIQTCSCCGAYQLWRVGSGREGRQDGDHEEGCSNVDGVGAIVFLAYVPVQAAHTTNSQLKASLQQTQCYSQKQPHTSMKLMQNVLGKMKCCAW